MSVTRRVRERALLAGIALFLSACAATGGRPEAHVAGVSASVPHGPAVAAFEYPGGATIAESLEPRVFELANRVRELCGLDPLEPRVDLIDLARVHALDMANRGYFSHHSPDGEGPGERARRHEVSFYSLGENLARIRNSDRPAPLAIRGWLESAAHRRILLDERGTGYRRTGVGAARAADGTIYIAQVFTR